MGRQSRLHPQAVRETRRDGSGHPTVHLVFARPGRPGLCDLAAGRNADRIFSWAVEAFTKTFDPIIQILRPVSPLAWLPLGLVLFLGAGKEAGTYGALFTIAICSMWPTVLNTAVGVRAVPQDYLNVGRVLKLSRWKTLTKILIPATLPYMFTGFRLSLGIAWLVIVAAEMLTGRPGVGGFLWQEYNSLVYEHIILSIITIGLVGFVLDRLMSGLEARFKTG
jgi:nitrate/nitrite transport system permease protein